MPHPCWLVPETVSPGCARAPWLRWTLQLPVWLRPEAGLSSDYPPSVLNMMRAAPALVSPSWALENMGPPRRRSLGALPSRVTLVGDRSVGLGENVGKAGAPGLAPATDAAALLCPAWGCGLLQPV